MTTTETGISLIAVAILLLGIWHWRRTKPGLELGRLERLEEFRANHPEVNVDE